MSPLFRSAILASAMALVAGGVLTGCATSTMGQDPVRDEKVANQFKFKIYVNAFTGAEKADKDAKVVIENFMAKEKYRSYKIGDRRYNLIPEYYEYTVAFTK